MGCHLSCIHGESQDSSLCFGKSTSAAKSTTCSSQCVDISHFSAEDSKIIGIGGFGVVREVVKVSCTEKGTKFALKTLSKAAVIQRTSGPTCVITELKTLIQLRGCDFICNVHYAFQDPKFLYMVMDLAPGGDMRYNLKKYGKFSESNVKFYLIQLATALHYCHSNNILHRDVKPENIVMKSDGYIMLTDFGVAKILEDIDDCRSTSGTHGYMAPEIYHSSHIHGRASDWFSLSVTLHELLTGRRPFETSRLQAFRNQNVHNEDDLAAVYMENCSFLTPTCKSFLRAMFQVQPQNRLGHGGIDEVRSHEWLQGLNWESVLTKTIRAPIRPCLSRDNHDIKSEEVKVVLQQYITSRLLGEEEQEVFREYEYRTQRACVSALGSESNVGVNDSGANQSSGSNNSIGMMTTTNNNTTMTATNGSSSKDKRSLQCINVNHGILVPSKLQQHPEGDANSNSNLYIDVKRNVSTRTKKIYKNSNNSFVISNNNSNNKYQGDFNENIAENDENENNENVNINNNDDECKECDSEINSSEYLDLMKWKCHLQSSSSVLYSSVEYSR